MAGGVGGLGLDHLVMVVPERRAGQDIAVEQLRLGHRHPGAEQAAIGLAGQRPAARIGAVAAFDERQDLPLDEGQVFGRAAAGGWQARIAPGRHVATAADHAVVALGVGNADQDRLFQPTEPVGQVGDARGHLEGVGTVVQIDHRPAPAGVLWGVIAERRLDIDLVDAALRRGRQGVDRAARHDERGVVGLRDRLDLFSRPFFSRLGVGRGLAASQSH